MSFRKSTLLVLFFYCTFQQLYSQSIGGIASGGNTYCDTLNSGFVSITGYNGNVTTWQQSSDGGANWTNNGNTFTSQSYFNLKQSMCYRAIVQDGAFPPDTSTIACITIFLPTVGGTIQGGGSFCTTSGSGTLNLIGQNGGVLNWQSSTNGGFSWSPIANTSTSLVYSNITQNTLYSAVVQNGSFCKIDTSAFASFTISPMTVKGTINYTGNDTVCYGINSNTLSLSGNIGNVIGWISSTTNGSSWNNIPNTANFNTIGYSNIDETTLYSSIVQSGVCPIDTADPVKITVLLPFPVSAGTDTTINQGQSFTLTGSGTGTPLWTPTSGLSNPSIFAPIASPDITTSYILTVTDANACVNSDTVEITVIPLTFAGAISTVFTPNGDGINDNWYIEGITSYPDNEVFVYNIYGNEVYSKKKYTNDWQGTYNGAALPDGTYFYIIKINDNQSEIKGSLDILRNK